MVMTIDMTAQLAPVIWFMVALLAISGAAIVATAVRSRSYGSAMLPRSGRASAVDRSVAWLSAAGLARC